MGSRNQRETATAFRAPADDEPLPITDDRERELRELGSAIRKRSIRTRDVGKVRAKLRASAEAHLAGAAAHLAGRRPTDFIPNSDYMPFKRAVDRAVHQLEQEERLATLEHHSVSVQEPSVYGPDSPNSYYADLASQTAARLSPEVPGMLAARASSDVDMSSAAVTARLDKHVQDVQAAVARGGEFGKRAKAILNESYREADPVQHRQRSERELRAFSTGGGATAAAASGAAAFVSPYFLMAQWAPYRSPIRTFADQCANFPMPPYGMQVLIPVFTSTDKASLQTEGATVAETVPSTGLEGAEVKTATGQLLLTQQWRDRMNTGGGAFDELISQELGWRIDAEVGKYVINQALVGATVVGGSSGTYTEASFWADLARAREQLADTAGTRLRATSLFTTTDLYGFITRQVDKTTERPIWPPWYATAFPLASDTDNFKGPDWPKYARYMGTVMPGDLVWLTDDAIPNYGTTSNTQVIVSAPAVAMVLCEGEGVTTAYPETKANELDVVLNCRKYVAAITRHAAGTATIQGAAYAAAEK